MGRKGASNRFSYSKASPLCSKSVDSKCKLCVEEVDSWCAKNSWDSLCYDACEKKTIYSTGDCSFHCAAPDPTPTPSPKPEPSPTGSSPPPTPPLKKPAYKIPEYFSGSSPPPPPPSPPLPKKSLMKLLLGKQA